MAQKVAIIVKQVDTLRPLEVYLVHCAQQVHTMRFRVRNRARPARLEHTVWLKRQYHLQRAFNAQTVNHHSRDKHRAVGHWQR